MTDNEPELTPAEKLAKTTAEQAETLASVTAEQAAQLVASISDLTKNVSGLQGAVENDRAERAVENQKRDERIARSDKAIKTANTTARRAVTVAILGVVVGLAGITFGVRAQASADDIVATRTEGRRSTCDSDNRFIEAHNKQNAALESTKQATAGIQGEIDAILARSREVPEGVTLTPEQRARLDAFAQFAADQKANVDGLLASAEADIVAARSASRDCTPEGIERFYNGR